MLGRRHPSACVPGLLLVLLLAACGIDAQRSPEPVPADRLPTTAESPAQAGAARGRVWGARGSRLVPVFVELPDDGLETRVRAVLALGKPGQRPPTALPSGTRLVRLHRDGDTVVLQLSEQITRVPVTELPLALGQLVFTVTERPDVRRVHVRSADRLVRYVDATGRSVSRPLARLDFAGLVEVEQGEEPS